MTGGGGEPIRNGQILTGPQFNEPMRVVTVGSERPGFRSVGLVGQQTQQFRQVTLTPDDLAQLTITDPAPSFDGDGRLLRLGLQARALGIAHKSQRYRLGEMLRDLTDHMLLLTATPHKGDPKNFTLFLQLLDRDAYADVTSIRKAMEEQPRPSTCAAPRRRWSIPPAPGGRQLVGEAGLHEANTPNRQVLDR